MPDVVDLGLGVFVFGLAFFSAALTSAMTLRFSRGGAVMEAMMQRSFLPEKQRRYLAILSVEGSMILTAALSWSLDIGGVIPTGIARWLVATFLSVGTLCVVLITWLGLRPSVLTAHERAVLRNRVLASLVLAPMAQPD